MTLDRAAAEKAAVELIRQSPLHRSWSHEAFRRCIGAAIDTEQYLILFEYIRPVAFLSWGWLCPGKAAEYTAGTHRFRPADFLYTDPEDQLWFIDLIAPFGHAMRICRLAQEIVGAMARERGIPLARMIRQRTPRRIGIFSTAERKRRV